MNRNTFPKHLEEGLNTSFGLEYRSHPEEWRQIFEIENSNKAFEEDVLITGFGAAPVKAEGAAVSYDDGQQGWVARYDHETIALAFKITQEAVEDNLYMRIGPRYSRALARALQETKEIKGAAVLNNGFTAGATAIGDGKALFATDHPLLGGGTFSNTLATPADLSEASLEDILIQIRKAVDDRNIPVSINPTKLIVPPELEYSARRILGSDKRVATADNDLNAIKSKGIFGNEPAVIRRLTDADAWFVKTDAPDGLKYFNRLGVQRGTQPDFESGDLRYKARERYSVGVSDPRAAYASEGAA